MTNISFLSSPVKPEPVSNPAVVLPARVTDGFAGRFDRPAMGFDVAKLLGNPEGFCRVFLGEHCRSMFNGMHRFSFEEYRAQLADALPGRTGRRLAIAAPRGAAKSTVHTLLFPIMDILSGRERHQVIISGTMQQSKNRLASIARELRTNGAIRDAFFGGRTPRFKANSRCIEIGNCRIEAFSAGSEMRGVSHGEYRPTRIILDDVEQSNKTGQAWLRRKLLRWYDEVVENLGDSYTHITIVGTILHRDSLLSTLLARPGYRSERYQSIIKWDSRPDLWRVWQRLLSDRSDRNAVETAEAYLAENREEMLAGTEVLWPAKEPYEKLMEKMLTMGRAAFFKEKQNSPIKDGDQIFDTAVWERFMVKDGMIKMVAQSGAAGDGPDGTNGTNGVRGTNGARGTSGPRGAVGVFRVSGDGDATVEGEKKVADLKYYGFLDPALGKAVTRDGDYAAIVTIGKAPDNTLYVMNVWMDKASPMKQVEQVFALHKRFRYEKFGFEANGFQETLGTLIRQKQTELRRGRNHWHLPIEKFNNSHGKHSRITLLEPHILAGNIVFQQDLPREFFVQADEYDGKRCNHDDALDALASCVEMIRGTEKNISGIRLVGRRVMARRF